MYPKSDNYQLSLSKMDFRGKEDLLAQFLAVCESYQNTEEVLTAICFVLACIYEMTQNSRPVAVENFITEVIPSFSLDEYKGHFRMSRATVEVIYRELSTIVRERNLEGLTERVHGGGKEQISLDNKLLIFLWLMANKCTYREIANLFNISQWICCDIVHRITEAFALYLLPKAIRWPTRNEMLEISQIIEESKGFPNVIGCIDGCHIPVKKPHTGGNQYYNRKDFYSIILQAVCREDLRFTDIFVGFPGRVHDARVFSHSPLYENGRARCGEFLILGDSAYPNFDWLLTPYKAYLPFTQNMRRYNRIHSSARVSIERAFGMLKGRFRRLKYIDQHEPETMAYTTTAACCLHNICLLEEDSAEVFEQHIEVPVPNLQTGVLDDEIRTRGLMRRNRIMQRLR